MLPGGEFVKDNAGRVDVTTDIRCLAAELFRRHIRKRAADVVLLPEWDRCGGGAGRHGRRSERGEPKVQYFRGSRGGNHDVLRLEVAMDHAGFVRCSQA